jgi:hypothetical protein
MRNRRAAVERVGEIGGTGEAFNMLPVLFATIAIALALIFGGSRRTFRSWPLLIASASWGLAAIYEWWFTTRYDPQAKIDIRVDLLLVGALAIVITLVCAAWSFRSR